MIKKFSKSILAKFVYNLKNNIVKKYIIDVNNGTSQYLRFFNDDLIKSINILKQKRTDENWDEQVAAKDRIYNMIDSIVAYGKKEMAEIIMDEFYLNDTLRKMSKNGEKIENE